MRLAFLTYDLLPTNMRLMPWRYILEVGKALIDCGHEVLIISVNANPQQFSPNKQSDKQSDKQAPQIVSIAGAFSNSNPNYQKCVRGFNPQVIYFPVTRRSVFNQGILGDGRIAHVAYFPGAWYRPQYALQTLGIIPWSEAVRYLLESITPGSLLVRRMQAKKVAGVVTLSQFTAERLKAKGWPANKIETLTPGLDPVAVIKQPSQLYATYASQIKSRRFILFMGPPKRIRGFFHLLEAFEKAAPHVADVALVCLMRSDNASEWNRLQAHLAKTSVRDRIIVVSERLNPYDIACFIKDAFFVALPFLVVPSEIPLAVIEALAMGKPVVISDCGGTAQFVGPAGVTVPPFDAQALSSAIIEICTNNQAYQHMAAEARKLIAAQLSWHQVAQRLVAFTRRVASGWT